jgi:hypothetical protein
VEGGLEGLGSQIKRMMESDGDADAAGPRLIGKTEGCQIFSTTHFVYWAKSQSVSETTRLEKISASAAQGGAIAYCDELRATIFQYSPGVNLSCPLFDLPHRVQSFAASGENIYWSGGLCEPREGSLNPNTICTYNEGKREAECLNSNDVESFGWLVAENQTIAGINYDGDHGIFSWNREWKRKSLRGVGTGFPNLIALFAGRVYWIDEKGELLSKKIAGGSIAHHGNVGDNRVVAVRSENLLVLKSNSAIFKLTLPEGKASKVADIEAPIPLYSESGTIAIRDEHVYWTRGGDNLIRRIRLDGSVPEQKREFESTPCGVATFDGILLYTFDDGRIFRTNFDGFR